jgi:hypothetical protein
MTYTINPDLIKAHLFMIIYLHGFNSTGNSAKGQSLKSALGSSVSFYTPTYHFEPDRAIYTLTREIKSAVDQLPANEPRMIIGSSLGGFYAQYLARQFFAFKVVLINPALGPINTLQDHLGENENFYSGEKYVLQQKHLNQLQKYNIEKPCLSTSTQSISTLLLIDKADEVIDYHYAIEKYQTCAEICLFEGGDHQFQHLNEAIPKIKRFYEA